MPLNAECQYALYSKTNLLSGNNSNQNGTKTTHTSNSHTIMSQREDENINQIRRIIREQSNLSNRTMKKKNSFINVNSDSSDESEISTRRFTTLPDIPKLDDVYYRTESKLVKEKEKDAAALAALTAAGTSTYGSGDDNFIDDNIPFAQIKINGLTATGTDAITTTTLITSNHHNSSSMKKSINHFGTMNKINHNLRLPALEKNINHSLQNTMDLDEDLPMNTCTSEAINQRNIYTSPGDRIISPIKRPQAPLPPSSAYRRKSNENSDCDSDNDIIW